MMQVKSMQEKPRELALRKRADARTLAERRAGLEAQVRDMALSDLAQVSARLKALHKELEEKEGRRWKQYELAAAMKIPPRTFDSWENGEVENRDGEGYKKMARWYSRKLDRKITPRWIVFGDEEAEPEEPKDKDLMGALAEADQTQLDRIEEKLDENREMMEELLRVLTPEPHEAAEGQDEGNDEQSTRKSV